MSSGHSITRYLSGLKKADEKAIRAIFDRCYGRVAAIGSNKLKGKPQRGFDADDVANSAFREFLSRAADDKFLGLKNREDLWQILTRLVMDKIWKRLREERAMKRGGGVPDVSLDEFKQSFWELDEQKLDLEIADERMAFRSKLVDDDLRRVVDLLADGLTHKEIADSLGLSVRTIDRRFKDICAELPRILGVTYPPRKG